MFRYRGESAQWNKWSMRQDRKQGRFGSRRKLDLKRWRRLIVQWSAKASTAITRNQRKGRKPLGLIFYHCEIQTIGVNIQND